MNLRRGLLRAWVIFSAVWVVGALIYVDPACMTGFDITGTKWWCKFPYADPVQVYTSAALTVLGPPVVIMLAGLAVAWIVRGFKGP